MYSSVFQLLKIGIGPSSVHTIGPMKAAKKFLINAKDKGLLNHNKINQMRVELYGALAQTSISNNTNNAIIMGLMGEEPEKADLNNLYKKINDLKLLQKINLLNEFEVPYNPENFITTLKTRRLSYHTNGMKFYLSKDDNEVFQETYFSIGGGSIESNTDIEKKAALGIIEDTSISYEKDENFMKLPFPFKKSKDLFGLCEKNKLSVSELIYSNERTFYSDDEIENKLNYLQNVILQSIEKGLVTNTEYLPGPLKLKRRAPSLYDKCKDTPLSNPFYYMNIVNAWALAVSEENAAGGKVLSAPTMGTSGVISSVFKYYKKFYSEKYPNKEKDFILTAGAIGILFKNNASISGTEAGCQAEIGVGCSMAAAGLTAALGGNLRQIEKAAEISMEHFIGLTCGSIGGLVQIPCIERNAVAAAKAINSASLALHDVDSQKISLDNIIEVMKLTGKDMKQRYKDTETGNMNREVEYEIFDKNKKQNENSC